MLLQLSYIVLDSIESIEIFERRDLLRTVFTLSDMMAEWLRRWTLTCATTGGDPEVVSSSPGLGKTTEPSYLVWAGTLVALYKREGLFVIE